MTISSPLLSLSLVLSAGRTVTVPSDYSTIQASISAVESGDTILIAPGVYTLTAPLLFEGKSLTVRAADSNERPTITMSATPDDPLRTALIELDGEAVALDGIQLMNGGGSGPDWFQKAGGAVRCTNHTDATFFNCGFNKNFCPRHSEGGAIYVSEDSSLQLQRCLFSMNYGSTGGAIMIKGKAEIVECTFDSNGAGVGGGVYVQEGGLATLKSSVFARNVGDEYSGGGMLVRGTADVENCLFLENVADDLYGGGMLVMGHVDLVNCTFIRNFGRGAAIKVVNGASAGITNCLFAMNHNAVDYGAVICRSPAVCDVTNCLFWGNTTDETDDCLTWPPTWCDVDLSGTPCQSGCLFGLDPALVSENDFHLSASSAAIDAGASGAVPSSDFDGQPRPCADGVDIGAYEYCPAVYSLRQENARMAIVLKNSVPVLGGAACLTLGQELSIVHGIAPGKDMPPAARLEEADEVYGEDGSLVPGGRLLGWILEDRVPLEAGEHELFSVDLAASAGLTPGSCGEVTLKNGLRSGPLVPVQWSMVTDDQGKTILAGSQSINVCPCEFDVESARISGLPLSPVFVGQRVILDGSPSTATSPLSYRWSVLSGPGGIAGPSDEKVATITGEGPGTIRVLLTVDDRKCGASASTEVSFEVQPLPARLRCDCNSDDKLDISDAVFILLYLFREGLNPDCLAACDCNSDAEYDISDVLFDLFFVFANGPAPATPYPACEYFPGCTNVCE
jgi:hypothetical protein